MSDLLRALAFAFRRRGAPTMERAKLLHMLTFDLRWLSPDPAKRVVTRAIQQGLLVEEDDHLRAAFDAAAVDVPVNFRPRDNIADDDAPLGYVPWILDEAEEERKRRGGLVTREVAQLIVARRRGEDVTERATSLSERLARPG